jgi:hypothetical protein
MKKPSKLAEENLRLNLVIQHLDARLSCAVDKQLLLLNRLLRQQEEFTIATDDARGKLCSCGAPMVALRTQFVRLCIGCKQEVEWPLDEGQAPLIGNNRQVPRNTTPPASCQGDT